MVWKPPTATSFFFDVARGRKEGHSRIYKFGRNADVGTGAYEAVWAYGGAYNFLQAASALRIQAGGNAADTAAGAGAQTITVYGLDENWDEVSETISTNGASASSPTSTTFIRVYRAVVSTVGTYHAANTGAITIETTGGTVVGYIAAGLGQTQMAIYSVPAGKTAYMAYASAEISASGGSKSATIRFFIAPGADDVSTPYNGVNLLGVLDGGSGKYYYDFPAFPSFPEKTDLWAEAIADTNATQVAVRFQLILIDN